MESGFNVDAPTGGTGERRLEVGIIGAGIAGLGAAIALGQAGHGVEVSDLLIPALVGCLLAQIGASCRTLTLISCV